MHTIGPRFFLICFPLSSWSGYLGMGGLLLGMGLGVLVMMELASRHAGVNRLRFPFFFSFGSRAFHLFFLDSPLLPVGLF